MGVTTWLDRITDESNLWLLAGKAEESKEYSTAAAMYLDDASACLARGSAVRAALSSFCAAECLSMMGASGEADWLYSESGRQYAAIADHGVSGSIREALWAMQRAHASYVLAGDVEQARKTLESYVFLVRRANPFAVGSQWLEMPKVAPRRRPEKDLPQSQLGPELRRAMEGFFALREPGTFKQGRRGLRARQSGGMVDDQESFVGQLG